METNPSPQVESKAVAPGYRSTEFWLTLGLLACFGAAAVQGLIPPEHAATFAVVVTTIYKGLRLALKLQQGTLNADALIAQIETGALAAGPDANGTIRNLHTLTTNEPQPAAQTAGAGASSVPDASGDPKSGGAPESAGSAQERFTQDPYPAPAAVRTPSPLAADVRGSITWPLMVGLALLGMLALALVCLSGCAGSRADQDFRRKVQAVDVTEGVTYDAQTKSGTGTVGARFELRDPDAKVVQPPRTGAVKKRAPMMWTEDGWQTAVPPKISATDLRTHFRFHASERVEAPDVPESWRRTLYFGPRVIEPLFTTADAAAHGTSGPLGNEGSAR